MVGLYVSFVIAAFKLTINVARVFLTDGLGYTDCSDTFLTYLMFTARAWQFCLQK